MLVFYRIKRCTFPPVVYPFFIKGFYEHFINIIAKMAIKASVAQTPPSCVPYHVIRFSDLVDLWVITRPQPYGLVCSLQQIVARGPVGLVVRIRKVLSFFPSSKFLSLVSLFWVRIRLRFRVSVWILVRFRF